MLEGAKLDEMAAVDGVRLVDAMAGAGFDAHRASEARTPAGRGRRLCRASTSSRERGSRKRASRSVSWRRSWACALRQDTTVLIGGVAGLDGTHR